jgi:oxidase EvaA
VLKERLRSEIRASRILPEDPVEFFAVRSWLKEMRSRPQVSAEKIPLRKASALRSGRPALQTEIVCVKSGLLGRETFSWSQPLLAGRYQLYGLILRRAAGRWWALVQAVEEAGVVGGCQIGPTVQTDAPRFPGQEQPHLGAFQDLRGKTVIFDVTQSSEGGRFYKDRKRYLAMVSGSEVLPTGNRHRWVTLPTLFRAVREENTVNMFARTFVSTL